MARVRLALVTIGHMPSELRLDRVRDWRSSLFELVDAVPSYAITNRADLPDWGFSDGAIGADVPQRGTADLVLALVSVPLQDNYYARRLEGNRVVMSLYEIDQILKYDNIPLENAVLRALYATALVFRRSGDRIPAMSEVVAYTHDETRGCLFDMNGIKSGLARSCHRPIICRECAVALEQEHVASNVVSAVQREIRAIQKPLYFRIVDWVMAHPVLALAASSLAAIVLGVIGSLLAAALYDRLR